MAIPLLVPPLIGKADPAVVDAVRILTDAVRGLHARSATPSPLPLIPSFPQIERALEVGGVAPLNITGLLGLLAQPQIAGAPRVETFPAAQLSQDGQLVNYQGVLYYFNAAVQPGQWLPLTSIGVLLQDTHANRLLNYAPALYALGTVFWETDRAALYMVRLVAGAKAWVLMLCRPMVSAAGYPADLAANDAGFVWTDSGLNVTARWTGAAWIYHRGIFVTTFGGFPGAAITDPGLLGVATDMGYQVWVRSAAGAVWTLLPGVGGPMYGTLSPDQKPGGMGANDAGLRFMSTDFNREYTWDGANWGDSPGQPARGQLVLFNAAPDIVGGWLLCNGAAGTTSTPAGGTAGIVPPVIANTYLRV